MAVGVDDVVVGVRAERGRGDDVDRQHDLAGLQQGPALLEQLGLEQAVADVVALRLQEGEAHAAADEQVVDLGQQRLDDLDLVADLGAAEHDHVGPGRVDLEPRKHLDLGGHQRAGGMREPLRDVVHAGVLAVDRAEGVVDVEVGEGREAVRERAALGVVLGGLGRLEADVLEQHDAAVTQLGDGLLGVGTDDVLREPHRTAEQLLEPAGHRLQGEPLLGDALGATQVRDDDDLRAPLGERPQQRQRGADAPVVGDDRLALSIWAVERDVQVRADQDPP